MPDASTEEIQRLENRLRRNPRSLMFARLADAYLRMGRVEDAKRLCEEGVREHPYYVTGHVMLGKCHLARGEHDAAEKQFKRALLLDPKYLAAHKYYGDLMKEIGWIKTFEMSYRKILQIDPLDQSARAMLGDVDLTQEVRLEEEEIAEDYVEPEEAEGTPEDMIDAGIKEPLRESAEKKGERGAEELSDKQEEKFSGILDDIFKDEIMDEDIVREEHEDVDSLKEYSEKLSVAETPEFPLAVEPEEETRSAEPPSSAETPSAEAKAEEDEAASGNDFELEEMIEEAAEDKPDLEELDLDEVIQPRTTPDRKTVEPEEEEEERQEDETRGEREEPASRDREGLEMGPAEIDEEPPPKVESRGSLVTPTLGEIYAAQGQYAKALEVYHTLSEREPDNPNYHKKIEQLEKKLAESEG